MTISLSPSIHYLFTYPFLFSLRSLYSRGISWKTPDRISLDMLRLIAMWKAVASALSSKLRREESITISASLANSGKAEEQIWVNKCNPVCSMIYCRNLLVKFTFADRIFANWPEGGRYCFRRATKVAEIECPRSYDEFKANLDLIVKRRAMTNVNVLRKEKRGSK